MFYPKLYPDPLLKLLPHEMRTTPARAAALYAWLAVGTSIASSLLEGRFIGEGLVTWRGDSYRIYPFIYNFSTILDFLLLNPLVIFYLHSSRAAMRRLSGLRPSAVDDVRPHGYLWASGCMVAAILAMSLYYSGFLSGNFFDAVVAISADGRRLVTITGWIVFIWTAIAIYYVFIAVGDQCSYLLFVNRLRPEQVAYDPTHNDEVAGFRTYAEPALYFLKLSAVVLVALLVFAVYDFMVFDVSESRRIWFLPAYLLVVVPLTLTPIIHLHKLMKEKRAEMLQLVVLPARNLLVPVIGEVRTSGLRSYSDAARELEALDVVRNWVLRQPVWPLPIKTLVSAGAYLSSVALPVIPKLFELVLGSLGFQ